MESQARVDSKTESKKRLVIKKAKVETSKIGNLYNSFTSMKEEVTKQQGKEKKQRSPRAKVKKERKKAEKQIVWKHRRGGGKPKASHQDSIPFFSASLQTSFSSHCFYRSSPPESEGISYCKLSTGFMLLLCRQEKTRANGRKLQTLFRDQHGQQL